MRIKRLKSHSQDHFLCEYKTSKYMFIRLNCDSRRRILVWPSSRLTTKMLNGKSQSENRTKRFFAEKPKTNSLTNEMYTYLCTFNKISLAKTPSKSRRFLGRTETCSLLFCGKFFKYGTLRITDTFMAF